MNKLKLMIVSLVAIMGMATVVTPVMVGASAKGEITKGFEAAGGNRNDTNQQFGTVVKKIVNIMLYVLGALCVIMIVFGGIRYTTSAGDSSRVKASKDTIMYAVIGLVIALLAYAIVNFVLTSL